jgi:hypothetical protein
MSFIDLLAAVDRSVARELGETVTYAPGVGEAVEVEGVFDSLFELVPLGEPGVASNGPAVFLLIADLPSSPLADKAARVTIRGVTYRPHTPRPDGQGGVVLELHEV